MCCYFLQYNKFMKPGGKAHALQRLKRAGFNVPAFFVCDKSWNEEVVLRTLERTLPHEEYFAVRSSAFQEDGEYKSYAGHFYSAVAVQKKNVFKEIQNVLGSYGEHGGAVIVQVFVPSDISGVVFSANGDSSVVINSNFGLCKNVVEGKACDEFITNDSGLVLKKTISAKKPVLHFSDGTLLKVERSGESMNDEQIKRVVTLAKRLEKFFKKPQDIEWCFKGEELYLLQSRPITKSITLVEQEYFDSANIAESYSGIVLPLTASFAERIYRVVYTDFLRMSGVSKRTLAKHASVFENLLGFFHGRMYYNMNNWYRLAQFVPGYKRNKENFETMITSNLRQEIATTIKPSLLFSLVYPVIVLVKVIFFGVTEKRFKNYVEQNIKRLKSVNFETLSLQECGDKFYFLEHDLLRKWYVTLENDFFVMTYLGILQKLYPEENLQEILLFKSKATEQVRYLKELAAQVKEVAPLWKAVQLYDVKTFQILLNSNENVRVCYEQYLEKFGGRFANELKLETVGLDEDVQKMMTVLQAYASYIPKPEKENEQKEFQLSFFKKILFAHSLKQFKKYASQREDFRLYRSNMFSITRSIFRRVGRLLVEQGILESADDIFYVTVDEVLSVVSEQKYDGLSQTVSERKCTYAQYGDENPPSHFLARGGEMIDDDDGRVNQSLTSRGVSAGVVTGRVKVMKEFEMPSVIDFEILVTKHTDPGWTALIALSKGLIIEHGGVLSHASIVARELEIPAVIGVKNATDVYSDGQRVEINGSTGKITVL